MKNFGLLRGEKISKSKVSFKWWMLVPHQPIIFEFSSIDLGSVHENFSDCYLKFKGNDNYSPAKMTSLFLTVSDDFLSKCKNISLEVIFSVFKDQHFDTKYLKQYPDLDFNIKNEFLIFHESNACYNRQEILFDLTFLGILTPSPLFHSIQSSDSTRNVENSEDSENARGLQNHNALSQDLIKVYTKSDISDMTIRIDDEVIPAHKFILSTRSSVFKNMLEHDCVESQTNCITITDCDKEIFKKFLKYLYAGELEYNSLDTILVLYSMADKYNVQSLQESCSQIIQSRFDSDGVESMADSVCQILELAYYQSDQILKEVATSFIVRHFDAVGRKQGWKDLLKNNAVLTSHVLVEIATQQGNKN